MQDFREVSRAVEIHVAYGVLVGLLHAFYSVAFWFENVTIKSKTVRRPVQLLVDLGSEAIGWDFFVGVIVLEYISHCSQRLQVLVFVWIPIVQRIKGVGWTVREREVNGDIQVYLTPSKDVFQEIHTPFDLELVYIHLPFFGTHCVFGLQFVH